MAQSTIWRAPLRSYWYVLAFGFLEDKTQKRVLWTMHPKLPHFPSTSAPAHIPTFCAPSCSPLLCPLIRFPWQSGTVQPHHFPSTAHWVSSSLSFCTVAVGWYSRCIGLVPIKARGLVMNFGALIPEPLWTLPSVLRHIRKWSLHATFMPSIHLPTTVIWR